MAVSNSQASAVDCEISSQNGIEDTVKAQMETDTKPEVASEAVGRSALTDCTETDILIPSVVSAEDSGTEVGNGKANVALLEAPKNQLDNFNPETNQANVNVTDLPLAASAIKDSADEMDTAMSQLTLKNLDSDSETPASVGIMEQTVNAAAEVYVSLQIQDAGSMEKLKEQDAAEMYDFRNPDYAGEFNVMGINHEENYAYMLKDIVRAENEGTLPEMCTVCEKEGQHFCNGCKQARYCSRDCQVADWSIHKNVCADFANTVSEDKRPSPEHRRILFFPTYSTKPEICWAVHYETDTIEWVVFDHPDLDLFKEKAGIADLDACRGANTLNMHNALGDRSRRPGEDTIVPRCRDITPRDVHTAVRLLEHCDCVCVADPSQYHGRTISGLRINDPQCQTNIAMGATTVFEVTRVPISVVHRVDYPIPMAFKLGLRWYIRPGNFIGNSGHTNWCDANLRYMAFICDIKKATENTTAINDSTNTAKLGSRHALTTIFEWGPFIGTVVVLHGSGQRLDINHVFAFNAYLDSEYARHGRDGSNPTREGFQKFWTEWKVAAGKSLASVPSPYKWEKASIKDELGFYDPQMVMELVEDGIKDVWGAIMAEWSGISSGHFVRR
ncbi:hypothetical protein N0V88_004683 [Collariella sp. IMI 366227]|nr:hypothetical protein N0V88_004683 [Collariella sp. IMI 366227]